MEQEDFQKMVPGCLFLRNASIGPVWQLDQRLNSAAGASHGRSSHTGTDFIPKPESMLKGTVERTLVLGASKSTTDPKLE